VIKFFTTLNAPFVKMHELTDSLKSQNITTLGYERRVYVQARVPVGRTIMELPAGMLDDDAGDFVGTAAREVHTHLSSPGSACISVLETFLLFNCRSFLYFEIP
jgi:hypothetical protein